MYKCKSLSIALVLVLLSCGQQENKNVSTYKVSIRDFENAITVSGTVKPVKEVAVTCPQCDGVITFLTEDGKYVEKGDVICIIEDVTIQANYDDMLYQLENAGAALEKTRADLAMEYALLEAQVKTNDTDVAIASMDSLQLKYASPTERSIKELELKKVAIDKARNEKKLGALSTIHKAEIRKQELTMERFKARADAAKARLDGLTIKAPESGMMLRANNLVTDEEAKLQVNDAIWTRLPIASIPDPAEMKVIISMAEQDFKAVNIGDSVVYTFDAMPGNTGWGKIIKKAPVGTQYNDTRVKFFEVEASIDSVDVIPDAGLSATCRIYLKKEESVLVIPNIAVFEEDSIRAVYVKHGSGFEMRQVLTGSYSLKDIVIKEGLREGEEITLTKPSPSQIKKEAMLPDSVLKPQAVEIDAETSAEDQGSEEEQLLES